MLPRQPETSAHGAGAAWAEPAGMARDVLPGMRRSPPLACLALLLSARGDAARAVVRGEPTTANPATVFLDLQNRFCSGTLIGPHTVLTARHCTAGRTPAQVRVSFEARPTNAGLWIGVERIAQHPEADLAAIVLAQSAPAPPMPVFTGDLAEHVGDRVLLVGFGTTGELARDPGVKRDGWTRVDHVDATIVYTGYDEDRAGACHADSGGTVVLSADGLDQIAGVVSFGTGLCGTPGDGSVRTDAHRAWIAARVLEADADVCAADGSCSAGCPGWLDADPDCAGCTADGTCRGDCPTTDPDCETGCAVPAGTAPHAWLVVLLAIGLRRRR